MIVVPLIAVPFVDFDQGSAEASGDGFAFPSTIRRAQQCRHRSD
jgi:hypothetical protein